MNSVNSKQYTAVYFVRGQYLGNSTFRSPYAPHCLAYFCSTCGDIWARVQVEDPEAPESSWELVNNPCERHKATCVQDWGSVPGSLLRGRVDNGKGHMAVTSWARAIEHLPPEVLRREFDVNLKWYDNLQNEKED